MSDCVWLDSWQRSVLFHLSNVCFMAAFCLSNVHKHMLFMHALFATGFLLYSTWAWNVVCAPSMFSCSFGFVLLNIGQVLYIIYRLRPVRFSNNLENIYLLVFEPLQVSRKQFNSLISSDFAYEVELDSREPYAIENLSRPCKLAILVSGRMQVLKSGQVLHRLQPGDFLDSPEFCSTSLKRSHKRVQVSIIATTRCHLLVWERTHLEYLMIKKPYFRTIFTGLVSRDVIKKMQSLKGLKGDGANPWVDARILKLDPSASHMSGQDHPQDVKEAPHPSAKILIHPQEETLRLIRWFQEKDKLQPQINVQ